MYYHILLYHITSASEQTQSIAFSVQYYSHANGVYRSRSFLCVQLTVTVRDVNDNWPKFTTPHHLTVSEDTSVGSSVFQLAATDADLDDAGRVSYSLVAGDGSSMFSVSATDGVVSTQRQLDRETKDHYQLTLVAADSGTPARSTSVVVTVDVADANDHTPVFSAARYVAEVTEQTPVGSLVTTVGAVDGDRGLNAEVRYDLVSGDEFGTFVLDGYGGELRVRRTVEHRWRSKYLLTVLARDLGTPPRSSTTTVVVSVVASTARRRATSPPFFPASPYIGHVVEHVPAPCHVTRVSALTADDVTVTYALADRGVSGLFAVNASSGHVTTAAILDRERAAVYTFNVVAVTSGAYFSLSMCACACVLVEFLLSVM